MPVFDNDTVESVSGESTIQTRVAALAAIDRIAKTVDPGDASAAATLGMAFGIRVASINPEFSGKLADLFDRVLTALKTTNSVEFDPDGFLAVADLSDDQAALAGLMLALPSA